MNNKLDESSKNLSSTEKMSRILALKSIDRFLDTLSLYCSENLISRSEFERSSLESSSSLIPNSHIFTVMFRVLMFHLRKVQEACGKFEASQCIWNNQSIMKKSLNVLDDKMRYYVTKRIDICIQKGIDSGNMSMEKLRIVKRVISSFEIDSLHMGMGWSSTIVGNYKKWMVVADRENPNGVLKNMTSSDSNIIIEERYMNNKERISRSISPSSISSSCSRLSYLNDDKDKNTKKTEEFDSKRIGRNPPQQQLEGIRKERTTRLRRSSSASSIVISDKENSVVWGFTEERRIINDDVEESSTMTRILQLPPLSIIKSEDDSSIVSKLIEKAEKINSEAIDHDDNKNKGITSRNLEMKRARSLFGIK